MQQDENTPFSKAEEKLKLAKIQAEIDKIQAETKALNKSPLRQPSTWIPLLTAVIGILSTSYGWYNTYIENEETNQNLQVVTSEKEDVSSYNMGLENRISELEDLQELYLKQMKELNPVAEPLAEMVEAIPHYPTEENELKTIESIEVPTYNFVRLARKVAIQFKGNLSSENVKRLQTKFNQQGIPTTPPELIKSDFSNSVRYFYESDAATAKNVADSTKAYFESIDCPIVIESRYLEMNANNIKEGTIEIWLNHSCK